MNLEEKTKELRARFGDYVKEKEFMEITGISSRTAYLAVKKGLVRYREIREGFSHFYRIPVEDVASYIMCHEAKYKHLPQACLENAIAKALSKEPDLLLVSDVTRITGAHANSVRQWITKGLLKALPYKRRYLVTKRELIKYLSTPYFWSGRTSFEKKEELKKRINQ